MSQALKRQQNAENNPRNQQNQVEQNQNEQGLNKQQQTRNQADQMQYEEQRNRDNQQFSRNFGENDFNQEKEVDLATEKQQPQRLLNRQEQNLDTGQEQKMIQKYQMYAHEQAPNDLPKQAITKMEEYQNQQEERKQQNQNGGWDQNQTQCFDQFKDEGPQQEKNQNSQVQEEENDVKKSENATLIKQAHHEEQVEQNREKNNQLEKEQNQVQNQQYQSQVGENDQRQKQTQVAYEEEDMSRQQLQHTSPKVQVEVTSQETETVNHFSNYSQKSQEGQNHDQNVQTTKQNQMKEQVESPISKEKEDIKNTQLNNSQQNVQSQDIPNSQKYHQKSHYSQYQNQQSQQQQESPTKEISNNKEESPQVTHAQQKPTQTQENQENKKKKNKKKKKKLQDQGSPLPIITAEQPVKNEAVEAVGNSKSQNIDSTGLKDVGNVNVPDSGNGGDISEDNNNGQKILKHQVQQARQVENISPNQPVDSVISPSSAAASIIILEAQKERIGTTLQFFFRYLQKHERHTKNQKKLIHNIQEQIEKKRVNKQPLCNSLKDYFSSLALMSKQFYEKSYKFTKSDKQFSSNPLINMKQQLKAGLQQLIFLRKATGNDFHRLSDFITNTIQKSLAKCFMDYWNTVTTAQNKHKEKRDQFLKKEKEFIKRISKVEKCYTKGKQGVPQDDDLFVEMMKFIAQEKEYKKALIDYGMSLIPLRKTFVKAEEMLYQQLQVVFNNFKNQAKNVYSLNRQESLRVQKFQNLTKQNNSFEKLSDLTDLDYVRSVLSSFEKESIKQVTDKEFQKVLNMVHFEWVVGSSTQLLKGTTSKSFDLKNKSEQLVDTISGNLVLFNKETTQMVDKFAIKRLTAKIVADGVVQLDQLLKGIIFNSNKTVRITFRDNDRAEQLICFLNQLQQSQVLTKGYIPNK